ncbi:M23 family metallopeptidase [Xylanibacter muris]|uniref:M23 family metallopeptidase n=1 Tax=Xylanibacter muris TaxID=2736290 RepID=A0ABX2ANE4_9BACT|nr:M23 family metallopeptidase [Xylanibacter muris]NPD92746.1 M23 family metallopeptidase [Xylanibacter muris]
MIFASLLLSAFSLGYVSPVNYELSLAGNFGEPRPNHFHGGIDVRTGGVEGKPVFSIAEGYVSRITVGLAGFGNALYVTHPDGRTSVYCHLKSFSPRIKRLLMKWQYMHQSYVADVRLRPDDCPVSRGMFIAVSGNTGASLAPHIHLELHDTKTWNMLDPLDFLGHCIKDNMAPTAHGFMAYPQNGKGVFNGGSSKQTFGFTSHHLSRKFTAWGKVGFGIWADDYMENAYNRYGIRRTLLTVDGKVVFESTVDNIPVQKNMMVNSWGDYEHFYHTGVWYMKSFSEPGNTLQILRTDENRGLVDFNEERDYHIKYTLSDIKGNTSEYTFTVTGEKHDYPAMKQSYAGGVLMRWNRINVYSVPGMQLVVPQGLLPDDVYIRPRMKQYPDRLSSSYSFYAGSMPLKKWGEISIFLKGRVANPDKLYIVSRFDKERFMGGTYHDGWVTAHIRELGASYEIDYDDSPPVINEVGRDSWDRTKVIRLGIYDSKSGIKSYKGFVDGEFVLFEPISKSNMVMCRLDDTPVRKTGAMRKLKFIVTDNRDNTSSFETYIEY